MTDAELAGTPALSATFPTLPPNCLPREHILDNLEDIFSSGHDTILLDGPDGTGKTTLAAQFALRHASHAVSAFVRPSSRWGHDPDIIQSELANQIHWIVFGSQIPAETTPDAAMYRDLLAQLQRRIRSRNLELHFVLDGIDDLPESAAHVAPVLIDLLPFGYFNCRFLISAGPFANLVLHRRGISAKEFWPPNLSSTEIEQFFLPQVLTRSDLADIHRLCRGVPGKLASVRRLVNGGVSVASLMDGDRSHDIFATEARAIDSLTAEDRLLVSIIAIDPVSRTLSELSTITGRPEEDLRSRVSSLTFLDVSRATQVTFASEVLRRIAHQRLATFERSANEHILAFVMRDPESDRAITEGPTYFERTGQSEELLDFLTAPRFERLLERDRSLTLLKERGDLCLDAATRLHRIDHATRMALQQAALRSVMQSYGWRGELEALLATGDSAAALTLATSLFLKEDRLHALAVYAREARKHRPGLEPEVTEQITALLTDLDFAKLGSRAGEIAADLMFAIPSAAIQIAEQASWEKSGDRDWQLMRIAAAGSHSAAEQDKSLDALRSRIEDPILRLLSHRTSGLMAEYTAEQVLSEASTLEKGEDRLFLLKAWAQTHREAPDGLTVVGAALDLFIRVSEYRPTLSDLRRLALPLAFATSDERLPNILDRLDIQARTLEPSGPTEEYVRLQLLIARARKVIDPGAALASIIQVFEYTIPLQEASTRVACLAWLLRALPDVDPSGVLELRDHLHSRITTELRTAIGDVLRDTADHTVVLKPLVEALSKHHLQLVFEILPSVNTAERRDATLHAALDAALHGSTAIASLSAIAGAIDMFTSPVLRDVFVTHVLDVIATGSTNFEPVVNIVAALSQRATAISDPALAAAALAHSYVALRRFGGRAPDESLQLADEKWGLIEDPWQRVESAFELGQTVAPQMPARASEFVRRARSERAEMTFDSSDRAEPYTYTLRLVLRLFRGLIPSRTDTTDDRERLLQLIRLLPSPRLRAEFINDLATAYFAAGRSDDGATIVSEHIRPLLETAHATRDVREREGIATAIAPAYLHSSPLSVDELVRLAGSRAQEALADAAESLFTGLPIGDPYDIDFLNPSLAYEDLLEIMNLIDRLEQDHLVYSWLRRLTPSNAHRLTRQQSADFVRRLEILIDLKFPAPTGVQHAGYALVSKARVLAYRNVRTQPEWKSLTDAAAMIPNAADRAFVRSSIAEEMPTKLEAFRNELVAAALLDVAAIPAAFDRIGRYSVLADDIRKFDSARAREVLKIAIRTVVPHASRDHERAYKHVLDVAHRIDPTFSNALAKLLDDDPVRSLLRARIQDHVKVLESKQQISDGTWKAEEFSDASARSAWMSLGSLNSGRTSPLRPGVLHGLLSAAASAPIDASFPMLLLSVTSLVRKYSKATAADVHREIRPVFEGALSACQFLARVTARETAKTRSVQARQSDTGLIHEGEREAAFAQIADWLTSRQPSYLKVCDPYFGPADLRLLQLIRSALPNCRVEVLTSRAHQESSRVSPPYDHVYREHWRRSVSDEATPGVDIVIVGAERDGRLPIHDRWYVTGDAGLRIGTSVGGLGARRLSEISVMTEAEAREREVEIDQYLSRQRRTIDGDRATYAAFTL